MIKHSTPRKPSLLFWQKLVLVSGICMVFLAVGLTGINYWSMQRAGDAIRGQGRAMLEETNRRFLASIVKGQADIIDQQLEQAKNTVRVGAKIIEADLKAGRLPQKETLRLLLNSSGPYTTTIYYHATEGTSIVHMRGRNQPRKTAPDALIDMKFLCQFPDKPTPNHVSWSCVHTNPHAVAYDRVIDAVSPLRIKDGSVGYLGISVSVLRLVGQFNHRQAIRGSYCFLLDNNQHLVACPPLALVDLKPVGETVDSRKMLDLSMVNNPSLQRVLHNMALGDTTVTKVTFPTDKKYFAYLPLDNASWHLGLVVPVQLASITTHELSRVIAEHSRDALREMAALSFLLLGVTLILVALLSRKMSAPLKKITLVADKISQGDLDHFIPADSDDEIGILARSFNIMSRRLKVHIGDLKKQQARLTQSEKRYRLLFENMSDGFAYHEIVTNDQQEPVDYRYIEINAAFEKLTGLKAEALIGNTAIEVLPGIEQDEAGWIKKFGQVAQTGKGISIEQYAKSVNRWYSVSAYSPQQGYFVTISRDVTKRKQAEMELNRLRSYLADIINAMPSILIGVEADGTVSQWNREAQRLTGMAAEEATGKPLEKIYSQVPSSWVQAAIRENRTAVHPRQEHRTTTGETRYEDVTIYPLTREGGTGAVIRVDDVTDRIRMEEMMIQSEKMLSVGGLAAGMAHEINNPLAGMLQTATVMANRLGGNLYISNNQKAAEAAGTTMEAIDSFMQAREIPRMLNTIQVSGQRVVETVSNMLGFARKSESEVSFQRLDDLIDKTLELAATDYDLKRQYDFKCITITRKYAHNLPSVPCESPKIQQVLLNILRNGAQAMQGSETQSPSFFIRTRLRKQKKMACIEIADNGPGMDEAACRRVFEPFFTTKSAGSGTGLGLSVSYFIITENHGGEMAVESYPGEGTTFFIHLPLKGKRDTGATTDDHKSEKHER